MTIPHFSVLAKEILHHFEGRVLKVFVDGTLGAGGHSQIILEAHPEIETFVGFDQDPTALKIAQERLDIWKNKTKIVKSNFGALAENLKKLSITGVDGILLDLGVSSMQLDQAEKGFSFMRDGPLDMRMDPEAELSAHVVINTWSETDLGRIFRDYGEEKQWRAAARAVVKARSEGPIDTTLQLAKVLQPAVVRKPYKKGGINPLTLVFQGLRICVNDELGVLERVLPQALKALNPGGRLAVITFHSLEDRIVKNVFRDAASDKLDTSGLGGGLFLDKEPEVTILTKKPETATEEELKLNPRSRSAKLRVVEKL